MKQLRNNNNTVKVSIASLVVVIVCCIESIFLNRFNITEGYANLYLMPLAYAAAFILFVPMMQNKCKYKRGFPYYLAQIVLAYRYLMLPLSCLYTDYFGGWTHYGTNGFGVEPSAKYKLIAILWMCSEIFFAELALYFGTYITSKMILKRKQSNHLETHITFLKNKGVIVLFTIFAFMLLVAFQRQVFSQFLTLDENFSIGSNTTSGSFFKIIYLTFRFSFLMLGYAYCAKKYKYNRNKVWVIIAMMFLVVYIGFSVSSSRWNLILPTLASVEIFKESFKPFPKILLITSVVIAAIGVFSISFYKYGYLLTRDGNPIQNMILLTFQQSNEYISGPRSVAQGLETLAEYGDRIKVTTFFNSMFSGFAGLASLTNNADKLQMYFNFHNLGLKQDYPLICPTIIEGIAFIPIFPWFFSSIFEIMVCVLDYLRSKSNKFELRFLLMYITLWFALCFNVNTKIEFAQISQIIPCILLFVINSKIKVCLKHR